jgi:hypothetical protein
VARENVNIHGLARENVNIHAWGGENVNIHGPAREYSRPVAPTTA